MTNDGELDLLRRTVHDVLADGGSAASLPGFGRLGLLGLLVAEDRGGSGWCPVEATVVADVIGRAVAAGGAAAPGETGTAVPWLSASIAAAALATADGVPDGGVGERLARTLDGTEPTVAVAGRIQLADGTAMGSLHGVEDADRAPALVVLGDDGHVALVDLTDDGVALRPDPTSLDATRALWRVDLAGAPARSLDRAPAVRCAALVLAAATTLGSLRAALDRLVPYLRDRVAFGAPVASFQSIQHRLVDLALLEVRAGVAIAAAARALVVDPLGADRAAAVAHAFVAEHVPLALDECIQLTGGIGFTWEYPLHHELRRAVADGAAFGTARTSRERLLAVTGWV